MSGRFLSWGEVAMWVGSVEALEGTHAWPYAEHVAMRGKPLLTPTNDALDAYTLDVVLHHDWSEPAIAEQELREQADRREPFPLVMGVAYLGRFVATELVRTWLHSAGDGTPLMMRLRVSFKEWAEPDPVAEAQRRKVASAPGREAPLRLTLPHELERFGIPPFAVEIPSDPASITPFHILRNF